MTGAEGRGPGLGTLRTAGSWLIALPAGPAWGLAAAWGALIFALSSRSLPAPVRASWSWELLSNLAHAPLFGILTLFVGAACLAAREAAASGAWPVFERGRVALVLALVMGYGAIDEWHQGSVPGRDPSALDLLTDLAGAALVLWIAAYLGRRGSSEGGLWLRLGLAASLCVASAALATLE